MVKSVFLAVAAVLVVAVVVVAVVTIPNDQGNDPNNGPDNGPGTTYTVPPIGKYDKIGPRGNNYDDPAEGYMFLQPGTTAQLTDLSASRTKASIPPLELPLNPETLLSFAAEPTKKDRMSVFCFQTLQ